MDIECKHEQTEEMDGYVFCTTCGLETERFFGCSRGCKKRKEKNFYCDICDKSFLREQGLQRHLKSIKHKSRTF